MNANKNWKILQIIPAHEGWTAVHCQESKNHEIRIFNRPIVCWALVEPIGESAVAGTEVRGIEQGSNDLVIVEDLIESEEEVEGHGTDQNRYFLGYDDPGAHKESDYWLKRANNRLRVAKDKAS